MKKGFIVFAVLMISHAAMAQKGFDVGVSGTFNSTWILNQNNYDMMAPYPPEIRGSEMDYRMTWGWNAGAMVGYNFTRNWGLRLEVQYNQTGQKYEDNFQGPAIIPEGKFGSGSERVNMKRSVSLDYVQLPILVRYMASPGRVAKFFVALGPQFGFRTGAKESIEIAGFSYSPPDSLAFTPDEKFKKFDAGLALQVGADIFATDNLYFEIGLSAYGGLNDLNGKKLKELGWYSKNDSEYQKSYNFRFGLMVGVHYIIGKGREY